MHLGLVMECDYRYGTTQEEAFAEAFDLMETAETEGLDGVWLAERHFAAPGGPLAGIVIEPNVGGGIPRALVLQSVRLFAQEVAPRLRP